MWMDYTSTVCRCGWRPAATDQWDAAREVSAHHAAHGSGALPDYDTYPPMSTLPPTDTEQSPMSPPARDVQIIHALAVLAEAAATRGETHTAAVLLSAARRLGDLSDALPGAKDVLRPNLGPRRAYERP
jgi:hypothetical protein